MKWSQLFGKYGKGKAIKFLPNSNYIVGGVAESSTFTILNNGTYFCQPNIGDTGSDDGGYAIFNSANQLLHSSYLGGTGSEQIDGIAIDANNNIYFTGSTSNATYFNTSFATAYNAAHNGNDDYFIFGLNSTLTSNFWSTHIGGTGRDYNPSIAIDNNNRLFLVGSTSSTLSFPLDNDGGIPYYQATKTGASYQPDGSVTRFKLGLFSAVGINELAAKTNGQLVIYPNQASTNITIKSNDNETFTKLEVLNQLGQTVLVTNLASTIDVSSLSTGIYIIKASTAKGNFNSKFIKN